MLKRIPRYSAEETERRAAEVFERSVRDQIRNEDPHKYLLIDVDSGDYEVDEIHGAALERLRDRHPDAQIWARRVGSENLYRFGGGQWHPNS